MEYAGMLILGLLGNLAIYSDAVSIISQWHMFFSLSPFGILAGMMEAAVITFGFVYLFGSSSSKLK
ncbi:MAG: hypothetical protein RI601_00970 [Desulfurivibrionaceae bacterium]|nr:hypothetical protein [Desulfurivibrionaceae bacterium]